MQYELFYLVGEAQEPGLEKIKSDVENIVAKEGGKWLDPEIIEKRKMAYKIKRQYRGTYVARRFDISAVDSDEPREDAVQAISKHIKLNQDILRFLIVKTDDLPELKSREEIRKTPLFSEKRATKKPIVEKPKEDKKAKTIDEKLEEILKI